MQISRSSSLIKETDSVLLFYQIVRLNATAKVPPIDCCSGRGFNRIEKNIQPNRLNNLMDCILCSKYILVRATDRYREKLARAISYSDIW